MEARRKQHREMKVENTLENKAKFYGLYQEQKVLRIDDSSALYILNMISSDCSRGSFLELTTLSAITDEDAIEVGRILFPYTEDKRELLNDGRIFAMKMLKRTLLTRYGYEAVGSIIDYLRSRSYALPFMGLSVEELINYGWIRLKD